MQTIPNTYKDLGPEASLLFLNLHFDAAVKVVNVGSIPAFGELLSSCGPIALGVERFNASRAARRLPRPWSATVAEFVYLEVTPCSRTVFASITGQSGAVRVEREDVVSLCIDHDVLRSLGQPLVYADRLCTRDDARFSGDRDLLQSAAWQRIRKRDFRPDPNASGAVHHYDAAVLAWGALTTSAVQAVICKSPKAVDRFRSRCPDTATPVVARADLLW